MRPMTVYDAVRTVLAVRRYASRTVPEEIVRRIVEAGPFAIAVAVEKTSACGVSDASRAMQSMYPRISTPSRSSRSAIPRISSGGGTKKRKPLSEGAHRERFGTPFA